MADLFQALADPTRRELLDRLRARGGQTLGELTAGASISRQGIAKHLTILEKVDLVVVHWEGRRKLHYLNPVPISDIVHRWVGRFEDSRIEALTDLKARAESATSSKDKKQHG